MQKHLSEHVQDLMRKASESAGFRFSATRVASKTKKIPAVVKEATWVSPVRNPKEKRKKIKLKPPSKKSAPPPVLWKEELLWGSIEEDEPDPTTSSQITTPYSGRVCFPFYKNSCLIQIYSMFCRLLICPQMVSWRKNTGKLQRRW